MAHRWDTIIFGFILLTVLVGSLVTLTTTPRLWTDEAISIHIARSFESHGVLSPQTAPNIFFESPHLIQSTGYPVTVSLAGFFKVFGFGVTEARAYMLLWIVLALGAVFFLARKLFSKWEAVGVTLLVATLASFYASGRTVVGEVPGFVLLLAGFYFLIIRRQYFLSGIFWGLAVVTKPAVFALIIPTIFLSLLFERLPYGVFVRRLSTIAFGMMPAAIVWIFLVLPNPFDGGMWREIAAFYKNPYSGEITQNIVANLASFFNSTTLIYFSLLFALVTLTWLFLIREKRGDGLAFLYAFTVMYSIFAFIYYLRSPGYLRYILIAELLILFILPHTVRTLVPLLMARLRIEKIPAKVVTPFIIAALIAVQGVHLFTASNIASGEGPLGISAYLDENFPASSIGILNAPILGLFTDPSRTFLPIHLDGLSPMGENPLLSETPPDVIVSYPSNVFIDEGRHALGQQYTPLTSVDGYVVYKKLNLPQ